MRLQKGGGAPPLPPTVEVVAVEPRDVLIYSEAVGTLEADVNATISALVTGYPTQQQQAQAQVGELIAIVQLYRALGGGWQTPVAETSRH